jgi:hypothetical protein
MSPAATAPVVLRHGLGRLVTLAVWAATALWLMADWPPSVAGLLLALGLSGLGWVLCWRPAVVVADDALDVRNPWNDVRIPWSRLDDATFGWALRLRAGDVVCTAAAAPGPARMGALYDRHVTAGGVYERDGVLEAGSRPPPALLAVLQRWSASQAQVSSAVSVGHGPVSASVRRRPAVVSRVVLIGSVVALAGSVAAQALAS